MTEKEHPETLRHEGKTYRHRGGNTYESDDGEALPVSIVRTAC